MADLSPADQLRAAAKLMRDRANGDNYHWTARHIRDSDVPLVASELDGCDNSGPGHWGTCPGTHTFWRFVPEEATHG